VKPQHEPAAVILAAGASSRMGRPKPLLEFEGETFLDRLITRFSGICRPVIVVLGYGAEQVRDGIVHGDLAEIVINPAPERGMLSSLQCGLERVPANVDAVLFTPVDLPSIRSTTIAMLAGTPAAVAVPLFEGRKGHPVRVSRQVMEELLALPLTSQARDVIHRHRAQLVETGDPGILHDVDTPQDYDALLAGVQP
jgi:CTP:molybdopterin cytidylyltransferase MocA